MSRAQGGSLLVAGFETWPTSPIGTYTIASENFGLGDPTALTRAIEQVSLDGERITGRRHSNRLLKLLIVIRANTRQALDLASGQMETATNQDTWQVQWTPPHLASETALPVIYEAYRAVTTIEYDVETLDPSYVVGAEFVRAIYIEAPAFPFGKTPTATTITGTSPIVVVDALDTGPTGATGGWQVSIDGSIHGAWAADTSDKTQGSQSWSATESGLGTGLRVRLQMSGLRTISLDLTPVNSLALDAKVVYGSPSGIPNAWTLNLKDVHGNVASSTVTDTLTASVWNTIVWPVAGFTFPAGFDSTNITSWSLQSSYMTLLAGAGVPVGHIDNLHTLPANSAAVSVANGGTFQFSDVAGTARANVSLTALTAPGGPFGALIAHRGPPEARPDYTPVVPLSPTTAPPYSVSLPNYLASAAGQRWNGTHAVWLGVTSFNGTGSRTVTVTFTQTGPGSPATSVSRTFVPADAPQNLLFVGAVTLPVRAQPDGTTDATANTTLTWTVTISDTNTADRYADLLVLDVRGPTVAITDGHTEAAIVIDEPAPTSGVGLVYAGADTANLYAIADTVLITGGPFTFEPGDNIVVFYSPQGGPTVTAAFHPRWLSTRNV